MSRQHKIMGTKLATTAAYHPEADGQSERTNQTVAIAIRFFVTENPEEDWTQAIAHIQFTMNTSKNFSTGCTPCEYLMGFNPSQGIDICDAKATLTRQDFELLRLQYREQAEEALNFAKVAQKDCYDRSHQPIDLKPSDYAALVLHHGYQMKGNLSRKMGLQRYGPLRVLEKIGKNAFRIERPPGSKIHDVVNAAQLEPCHTQDQDPWKRPFPQLREVGTSREQELKPIERILKRRVNNVTGQYEYFVQ